MLKIKNNYKKAIIASNGEISSYDLCFVQWYLKFNKDVIKIAVDGGIKCFKECDMLLGDFDSFDIDNLHLKDIFVYRKIDQNITDSGFLFEVFGNSLRNFEEVYFVGMLKGCYIDHELVNLFYLPSNLAFAFVYNGWFIKKIADEAKIELESCCNSRFSIICHDYNNTYVKLDGFEYDFEGYFNNLSQGVSNVVVANSSKIFIKNLNKNLCYLFLYNKDKFFINKSLEVNYAKIQGFDKQREM